MSENTKILSLPLIQGGQAQKHITHNEALRRLDALVQAVVMDIDRTAPPPLPDEGDRHIVAAGATGDWAGLDGTIAVREGDTWAHISPQEGWRVHVIAQDGAVTFDGADWTMGTTQTLGINTAADATNRLSVAAGATLLTHEGGGHQVKINKADATRTGSLLFQTDWSGRAEMGCAGSDDFAIKVSADGGTWTTAMTVDPATGVASFPAGLASPSLAAPRRDLRCQGRWYCEDDNRWVTFNNQYGIADFNHDQPMGTGAEPNLDWRTTGFLVEAGTTIEGFGGLMRRNNDEVTGFDLRLLLQHGPAGQLWDDDADTQRTVIHSQDAIGLSDGWNDLAIPVQPFVVPQTGVVAMFLRPVGTLGGTRYLYGNLAMQITA